MKALSNNRKEREKMAGEKMKKIKEAFRKLREKGKSIGINSCKILVGITTI